jgi:lysophospholipase L1-like esterase
MTTLTAGASASITLTAGNQISGVGAGTAVIGRAGTVQALTAGDAWQIGPYTTAQTVSITATSAMTYDQVPLVSTSPSPADLGLSAAVVAALPPLVSGGGILRASRSNVATRVLGARCVTNASYLGNTAQVTMRVAAEYDAIQLILFNPCATNVIGVKAAVSAGASLADPNNSAGTWVNVTWDSGSSTKTLPLAAAAANPSLVLSDWIDLEGTASRLLAVRVFIPSAGNTEHQLHSLSIDVPGWASYANREWIQRSKVGDFVAAPAGFNSASNDSTTPIAGVRYMARGKVLSTVMFSDSIGHGTGSTLSCDSYAHKGAVLAATESGAAIEYANFGWSGQTTAQVYARLVAHMPSIAPHLVMYGGAFSPNDGVPTAASIAAMKSRIARARQLCAANGASFAPVTGVPRNTSATASSYSAAEDDIRKGLNASAVRVVDNYIDADLVLADTQQTGVAARFQMTATGWPQDFTPVADWIHPSEAGHIAVAPLARDVILRHL